MTSILSRIVSAATLAAAMGLAAFGAAAQTLKIGVTPGALADSVQVAIQEAKKQGLDVKLVEFTDWTTPNEALASGDIDVNYFQHQAFLDNAVKERNYKFAVAGVGVLSNIGLYSYRIKRFDDLKEGAKVGVASDPVNQGRGLLLLEKAGLIKLRDGVGTRASVNDVVANPKKLRLVEVEGPQLVRAIDDLDLAQGYPSHFVAAGKHDVASSGLLYSGISDNYYAIRFVTRQNNVGDPRIKRFIQIYQDSPAVREQLHKSNANDAKLYTLAWLAKS